MDWYSKNDKIILITEFNYKLVIHAHTFMLSSYAFLYIYSNGRPLSSKNGFS
jgi:hypothetical protein